MLYYHLIELLRIICLPYSMGLDPNYAPDEIQRIITLSPARNSLNDESMEALICAQDWLRASITGKF
jgi:hypothetical protein